MHPYHFSLNLLKAVILRAPAIFPTSRKEEMLRKCQELEADPQVSLQTIEETIFQFGEEIWPYFKAFEEFYKKYGQKKEENSLKDLLSSDLLNKYLEFVRSGGNVNDFRKGSLFETFFTPDEKFLLGEAIIQARHQTLAFVEKLALEEKREEIEELIKKYQDLLNKMKEKLAILEHLAQENPKWAGEILEKIKAVKESFCFLEKNFTLEDLQGMVDYYQGVISLTQPLGY